LEGSDGFFHFGWDHYMFIGVARLCPAARARATKLGLYVEEFASPTSKMRLSPDKFFMLTNDCIARKGPRRTAQIIFLSSLFIFPCSSFPQVASGGTSTSIKTQVVSNLIVMPGYVNNSDKLEVVLDTGASENVLMPGLALKLNLHPTMSAHTEGIGKGQDETMHISSGARLAWGYDKKLTLDDQNIAALPIDYISQQTGHQVDAIFGSSLFQHFQIRVDYEHSEVTFTSGSGPSTSGTPIPLCFAETNCSAPL
jgi:hypothetical protein